MTFPLSDEHRQQVITVLWFWWTCWKKSSGGQQGCDFPVRCQIIEQFTLTSFLFQLKHFSSKQFWLLTKHDVLTSAIAAETFSSSVHHLSNRQPDQWRDDESSSSVLMNSSTSQLQFKFCVLCRDWQHYCVNSDILYGIVTAFLVD